MASLLKTPATSIRARSSPSRSKPCARTTRVCVRASQSQAAPPPRKSDGLLSFASSIGLPTEEGLFGFKPFAEVWCGRLAMMGFLTSIIEEAITGNGTLGQIYVMQDGAPDWGVLAALCVVFGGATAYGVADTLNKVRAKKMTPMDVARYKSFLALNNEAAAAKEARAMKARGDFTTPGVDMAAVEASKAAGSPADAFLSTSDVQDAEAAARAMKVAAAVADAGTEQQMPQGPAVSLSQRQDLEERLGFSASAELKYAMNVEMTNGRYAMIGFLAAVLVEAATGQGIIGQFIGYLKWSGLLGADSGF